MVFKHSTAPVRDVDDNMTIKDLFKGTDMAMNFVIGNLKGFHGTFINEKNTKYYFIIEGKATVTVGDEISEVEKGDFVLIPINTKHSIDGDVEFAVISTPPYDPSAERVISSLPV